jgi:hypothetical protein
MFIVRTIVRLSDSGAGVGVAARRNKPADRRIAAEYGIVKLGCPQSGQTGWHRGGDAEA